MKYTLFLGLIQAGCAPSARSADGFAADPGETDPDVHRRKADRWGDAARQKQAERLKLVRKGL